MFIKIFIFILVILTYTNLSLAEERAYICAVVPQFPSSYIYENWDPVLKALEEETGLKFVLKTFKNIPEFEKSFLKGEPDFAFMNPYHAVMAKRAQGYIPLIRDKNPLTGILVVKKDAPYKSVEDLDGKKIGFPAPNAYGASLYMRALLSEVFKIKFEALYLKTHDNVYRNVILGNVAAGGGVNQTLKRQPEEIKKELRILYETPPSAPHPIVVHPRVPKELREAFKKAFLKLPQRENLRSFLEKVQIPEPVEADYKRDYRPLEKLNLEKYLVLEEASP
jgi:phosphonate transport system substrate-binding protein